jgi:type IV pilus assembly protein PilA
MSGWYYADRNRQQHGPVSSEELVTHYRYGRVALDSLVWREGLPAQERLLRAPAQPVAKKGMSGGRIALIVAAALVLPCVGIGGILAAIAIPAYNDYTLRSKVSQAVIDNFELRSDVKTFHDREGRCPTNGEGGIGTPESYAGTYITRAVVGDFDDGTCGFELEFGNTGNAQIDGRKLWWDMGSDHTEWQCSSEIDDKWLPMECRG